MSILATLPAAQVLYQVNIHAISWNNQAITEIYPSDYTLSLPGALPISRALPGHYKELPGQYQALPGQYQGTTRELPGHYQGTTRALPGQYQGNPRHYQGNNRTIPGQTQALPGK